MPNSLVERLAEQALAYVVEPQTDAPVVALASPDALHEVFRDSVPLEFADDEPVHPEDALCTAMQAVFQYSVHTTHPRFLNQNFAGPDPVAVVGDWAAAALNTTNATFEAAPVFTLMERALLEKLASVAGFPVEGSLPPGMFCPGGSMATLYALQLARHRHQPDLVDNGVNSDRLAVFVSDAGHYSTLKSAVMLGLGKRAVYLVDTTADGALVPAALEARIAAARADGRVPLAVVATSGTTVTAAFDPLDAIADVCQVAGLWLHVDGCYGGSALFSPRHRHLLKGVERADSFVWNLHKMMGITQQCTALLLRDPAQLEACFATRANYIFQADKLYREYDTGDRTFQCARRVDALKLWLAWKAAGDAGFTARVEHAVDLAAHALQAIEGSDGAFAVRVATGFTNVVFVWVPPELRPLSVHDLDPDMRDRLHALAPRMKARMQGEGTAMVGYQPVHGLNAFRLLFMNPSVQVSDVDAVLAHLARYGAEEWRVLSAS